MLNRLLSKRKSEAISNGVFLIFLGILLYTNAWWPWILLAIWVTVALRQYFSGRIYDLTISSIILVGLFLISFFNLNWTILMPILFVTGGIYIIFREYFFGGTTDGEEIAEEIKDDTDN